jgi:hypothetical protein
MLLCPNGDIRNWNGNRIAEHAYTPEQERAILIRTIAAILNLKEDTEAVNEIMRDTGSHLITHFSGAIREINLSVVEDLITNKIAAIQLFGVDILLLRKDSINYDLLSNDVFYSVIGNAYAPLRANGMELLDALSNSELLKRQELLLHCCTIEYHAVRSLVRPIIKKLAQEHPSFGVQASEWLLPYLLRKESSPDLHEDVAAILSHELIDYIKDANNGLVLRLMYSDYVPAQTFGITVLERYIDAAELSIRQIIALGNHETKSVREWCWQYFENNVPRIKYEREEAIRLLDASWEDSRAFAKSFFREQFNESDWTPEILVGLADSVRPDIEAYGRELITRFFTDAQGAEYLMKLSQHPSEKMQLFATNYLDRFASNDLAKLRALEFYFRSVLTRVNKARVAKNRIFRLLENEGKQSEAAAQFVAGLISQISATVSIEDKAKCIEIMLALQALYNVQTPMIRKPVEERL